MLIPVFLRKVTKYEANGKKRMHQLSFPCHHHLSRTYDTTRTQPRHHSRAPSPTPLRTCIPPLTHLRLRRYAPPSSPSRIYAYAAAHLRHHSHTTAPPHSRTYDTTRTQPPHRSHAPAPTPLRTCDTHFQAGLRSLLWCFALFSTYLYDHRYVPSLQIVLSIHTNRFKYSYKPF